MTKYGFKKGFKMSEGFWTGFESSMIAVKRLRLLEKSANRIETDRSNLSL